MHRLIRGEKPPFHNIIAYKMDIDSIERFFKVIERLLDNGLVGALLAGGLTNLVSIWREEQQWKKQKDDEDLKWQREEQKREREDVRNWYQKSLVNLSILLTLPVQNLQKNKDRRMEVVKAIHDWSTFLLLRHSDKTLQKCVDDFVRDPDDDEAERLREKILEVAHREDELFTIDSPHDTSMGTTVEPIKTHREVEIHMNIDKDFRKSQLVEFGREIPDEYKFKYLLVEMTASQRNELVNIYFDSHGLIPGRIELTIPDPSAEQGTRSRKPWKARLDPTTTEPNQILTNWENACKQATNTAPTPL